jgi:hypothetical protein
MELVRVDKWNWQTLFPDRETWIGESACVSQAVGAWSAASRSRVRRASGMIPFCS